MCDSLDRDEHFPALDVFFTSSYTKDENLYKGWGETFSLDKNLLYLNLYKINSSLIVSKVGITWTIQPIAITFDGVGTLIFHRWLLLLAIEGSVQRGSGGDGINYITFFNSTAHVNSNIWTHRKSQQDTFISQHVFVFFDNIEKTAMLT